MSVEVRIPTPLRRVTNGQEKASVEGDNLLQIIDSLEAQFPGIRERLCDEAAAESFKLAESNAYAIPADTELGQEYFERNIAVVEQRLAIAGVRLAAPLNAIFDETKELPF